MRAEALIDLSAIKHNVELLKERFWNKSSSSSQS